MESRATTEASIEQAITASLQALSAKREEVEIEILCQGRSGFLGIGSRSPRVRVKLLPPEKTPNQASSSGTPGASRPVSAASNVSPQVVQAERFELLDKAGNLRAFFGTDADSVGIGFFGKDGNVRMHLVAAEDGYADLSLHDKQGRSRATFQVRTDGFPGVILNGNDGNQMALLAEAHDLMAFRIVKDGRLRVSLELSEGDTQNLAFIDDQDRERVILRFDDSIPIGTLAFFDADGKPLYGVPG